MPVLVFAGFGWLLAQSSLSVALAAALKQADALVTGVFAAAGWLLSSHLGHVRGEALRRREQAADRADRAADAAPQRLFLPKVGNGDGRKHTSDAHRQPAQTAVVFSCSERSNDPVSRPLLRAVWHARLPRTCGIDARAATPVGANRRGARHSYTPTTYKRRSGWSAAALRLATRGGGDCTYACLQHPARAAAARAALHKREKEAGARCPWGTTHKSTALRPAWSI